MPPVLALVMLMLVGAAQDGSGLGYPPGYAGYGSGGQSAFASDQMNTYDAPVASDAMASQAFDRDHRDDGYYGNGHKDNDYRGDDNHGDDHWGKDRRDKGHDWLGLGGYSYYYWSYPTYYNYGWYPYYTTYYPTYYYYTKPVVYTTYHYSPLVYNWYDPWWTSNVYGAAGKTHYTNSWNWKSQGGHHK